ncbi:ester cyclase [Agrococcus terreus]|uniref:Ester cyclase n=1 Tax=Agrococcus terreus TaxID=574649 RepID=A0ABQ2KPT9_9MICO|nr:ester cyclase [Agrococcus terreus]GGN89407.1 hypothetical protein GCM10010968_26050 [Agrococcus terreus]
MEPWEMHAWHADYLEACNSHDLERIRGFLDPGVRRAHLPGGAAAWVGDLAELFHGFPDWQWKRIQLVAEDDRIAAHLRGGGTHVGEFRGIAATRRRVNVAEFSMLRIRSGRIVEATGTEPLELLSLLR